MCLVAFAWRRDARWPLLLAANRDEFHARATAPLHPWDDGIVGGRDLEAGGTWLGVTRAGRFAAVTNFRDPEDTASYSASRGELVTDFLRSKRSAAEFASRVWASRARYRGFNLLLSDSQALCYVGSRGSGPRTLTPGVYALSNHLLDTPWPKVRAIRARVESALGQLDPLALLQAALEDRRLAPDAELPDTGVGLALERLLSAACIVSESYGTRSSSVLGLAERRGRLVERTLNPAGLATGTRIVEW
jgi:uncharacterized protein with NRDE domain